MGIGAILGRTFVKSAAKTAKAATTVATKTATRQLEQDVAIISKTKEKAVNPFMSLVDKFLAQSRQRVADAMKNKYSGQLQVRNYKKVIDQKTGRTSVLPAGQHTLTFKDGKIIESLSDKGRHVKTTVKDGIKTVVNSNKGTAITIDYNAAGKPSSIVKATGTIRDLDPFVAKYQADPTKIQTTFKYGSNGKLSGLTRYDLSGDKNEKLENIVIKYIKS